MTRDQLIAEFTKMLDREWEEGWNEGYRRGRYDCSFVWEDKNA